MITRARLVDTFMDLVRIDSPSYEEREIAERLLAELKRFGADARMDDAGDRIGSNAGNVLARLPGTVQGPSILLSAHMDTVMPGRGVIPVREKDRIRSDGSTILGADDKSGVAIILEVLQTLKEHRLAHPPIEVIFTICEEPGLVGAKHLNISSFSSRDGLVLDSGPAHALFTRGPAADRLRFTVHGLAAHAGICPENGINAIRVAADAISDMRLGRIDADTTANIGVIEGGIAVNIVPDRVVVHGEARAHDELRLQEQSRHMARCFEQAASRHVLRHEGNAVTPRVETLIERDYNRMQLGENAPVVQWVMEAARRGGWAISCQKTGGGCDANIFNAHGLNIANLGTGMRQIHTLNEYLLLDEFFQTSDVVLAMLQVASE